MTDHGPRPWHGASPIYAIDVGTFRDANGDGMGDLRGVIDSLDAGDGRELELGSYGFCWIRLDRS